MKRKSTENLAWCFLYCLLDE